MILSHVSHLKAGASHIRSIKMRSFWTMSGVIIGVASVISVVAIGEGIKTQIGTQIHHLGKNIITIRPSNAGTENSLSRANLIAGFSASGPLTSKDIAAVKSVKGLAASAPLTLVSGTPKGDGGAYNNGLVIGTTSDLPGLINQSMAYGAFWDVNDEASNTAVLGMHASQELFNEDVPLGRSFKLRGQSFIVRGIFNQFNTAPLSDQADFNNAIFIPNAIAEQLTNDTAPTYEILARPDNSSKTKEAVAAIKKALDRSHGGDSTFSIQDGNQNIAGTNSILDLLTRLIAGVAAIAMLVGEIGIMNVMMVSVAERTHEIGMRKAVGATNRQILGQFLVEASVLSLAGAVIGIIIALLVDIGLRLATNLQPEVSWQIVVLAAGVSLFVGSVFGTIPAFKAARKDPIQALRSE